MDVRDIAPDALEAQLRRMIASQPFCSSSRLAQLLRYVVERAAAGDEAGLKESLIACEVFGRTPGTYDSRRDAVVRVTAGKLRTKLAEYYAGEGAADPIVLTIPLGGYAPEASLSDTPQPALVAPRRPGIRVWVGLAAVVLIGAVLVSMINPPQPATDAVELYEKGKQADDTQAARQYLEEAVRRDPNFAQAWVALGNVYEGLAGARSVLSPPEALARASLAAQRALAIDPSLGEAHALRGRVFAFYEWNLPEAEKHLRRAIALAPRSAACHAELAGLLTKLGRHEEAMELCRRALAIDPIDHQGNLGLGIALYHAGHLEKAQAALERTIQLRENRASGRYYLGRIMLRRNRIPEAIENLEAARKLAADSSPGNGALAIALVRGGRRIEVEGMWNAFLELRRSKYVSPIRLAQVRLALDDPGGALDLLDEGARDRHFSMLTLAVDDLFEPLRTHPRFIALLKRIGLASEAAPTSANARRPSHALIQR